MSPSVALIGANGHGRWHRRQIAALQAGDRLRLVALADVNPIDPDPPVPAGVEVFTDHRTLLAAARPDVVVICTPPHTHLPIALDALNAGCDILLEKPPVLTADEHARLLAAVRAAGRSCQVHFQALGSAALGMLTDALGSPAVGTVDSIATVASWQRDDGYYRRAPWAGRRAVDGRAVLDGALVNPFAHAVMHCLSVAAAAGAGEPVLLEAERYRTRPIEVDDTAFARVTFRAGLRMMAAATLAGGDFIAGEVIVTGSAGRAVLEYPTDRLALPGDPGLREVPGRVGLLDNLLAHRADPDGVPLLAPLARTAGFTAVAQALSAPGTPLPTLLDGPLITTHGDGPDRVTVIRDINAVLRQAAQTMELPSESGVEWAVPPLSRKLDGV